jgi:hypothetical protein
VSEEIEEIGGDRLNSASGAGDGAGDAHFSTLQFTLFLGMVLFVFLVLNIVAVFILPSIPGSNTADRNPFRFRGFPEYLSGIGEATEGSALVLLSNSQAYAGEYRGRDGYPALLEKLQNESADERAWRVHNWSVDGITSMEYMLMAARLKTASPEVVVASIGYADFKGRNAGEGFSHCRSDLPRLAGRPAVVKHLPRGFWHRHGRVEDTLAAVVKDQMPMVRLPEYAWSWADQIYPGMQPLLYAPSLYFHPWELEVERKGKKVRISRPPPKEEDATYYAYDGHSSEMLEEFFVALKELDVPHKLVVACPGNHRPASRHVPYLKRFLADAKELADRHNLPYRDLSDALPREDFRDSLHFNRKNHRRYAEKLWAELNPDSTL